MPSCNEASCGAFARLHWLWSPEFVRPTAEAHYQRQRGERKAGECTAVNQPNGDNCGAFVQNSGTAAVSITTEPTPAAEGTPDCDLAHEPLLIGRFERDVELSGLVGEKKNAVLVLLSALSARLPRPLNLSVQGSSSAGKNHLLKSVAQFIPEHMTKFLTGLSPKALMHADKDEFKHKAVFIAEYEGAKGADYAIRTMQSEQVIEWQFVESSQNGIRNKKNRVEGPAAFIQATTRPMLHPENETRLLFIQLDESSGLTADILTRQAEEAAGLIVRTGKREVVRPWHDLIETLKLTEVEVPYAKALVNYFPNDRVRSRRDFPKLLGLIQASAFLHQHQREIAGAVILANADDYVLAKSLFEHCYETGPDRAVAELVRTAESFANREFSVGQLMQKTGWGQSKVYEVLKRAGELGCVCGGERWGRHRFIRRLNASPLKLPDTLPPW
jgi:hypothetical protein